MIFYFFNAYWRVIIIYLTITQNKNKEKAKRKERKKIYIVFFIWIICVERLSNVYYKSLMSIILILSNWIRGQGELIPFWGINSDRYGPWDIEKWLTWFLNTMQKTFLSRNI